ncbi:phosphoglycerate dehydrogenase [Synoicihabitans lomoniglobus]|uniref:D-3-phosphoglycerate dehydrogenase n=1 Tax=Synoicihabitans lomoniglobus TaxID=2909285 RepID=A0AAF0I762_9BACT|nr:phosphoglycerate dehydrogenase [Opitutaceae bacterium LMO-M01]WED66511.1 phosphoglycerate dehydrogenase [Opitutaceae bacterium LMO-M01]
MKILVADKISAKGVAYLREQPGFEVVEAYGSSPEQVLELVKDVHAIAVRSETKITREVLDAAPELKVVGRAGVGVDNVDVEAATERGVVVMNTPSGNTIATAELTFTHLLCGARPVPQAAATMKAGKWDRKAFAGVELFHKTLGIVGMGRIGGEVAKRAKAFGMRVVAYDPYLAPSRAKAMQVEGVELDTLLAESDFITVHMPLTDDTKYMIDEAALEKCKSGVRLFNCARGGIIKETALIAALKTGHVAAAGLDVYEDEPLAVDSELRSLPNVSLTPHLGASTAEAQAAVGVEIAEQITDVLKSGVIRNAVNMPSIDGAALKVLGPYLDLGTKLGTLVQQISPAQIAALKITYWGKIVDLDANAVTRAIQRGFLRRISADDVNDVNAPFLLKSLGIEAEVTKSNSDSDYTDLIQVEVVDGEGTSHRAVGTLLGKAQQPRIVGINGREVEVAAEGKLLVLENLDLPGMVGEIGTLLGRAGVNIADMSLSRLVQGETAYMVVRVDSEPKEAAREEIKAHPKIKLAKFVQL